MRPSHILSLRCLLVPGLTLGLAAAPADARNAPPRFEPISGVPTEAAWIDLAGDGATTGRAASGAPVFAPRSLESLPYDRGRIRIDSTSRSLALSEPVTALALQVDAERTGTVVELAAFAGSHPIGAVLFALDGKARSGVSEAVDGRIGIGTREPFDRVELRVAHAPDGAAGVRLESAWVGRGARGLDANTAALACQVPLGILYNAAFGTSLVPSPISGIAQGTAYAANLALKHCLTYFDEPDSLERRVPAGSCATTFRQDHMFNKTDNVLGVSLGYNSNWGELGSPVVYHHNTEVDVMLLVGTGTPPVAPRLDLEYWYNTANFEPTDRIWAQCDDEDGTVAFSQLDGSGPQYRCPFEAGRELSFPIGQTVLRWRVNARMSPLDYFPGLPGLPSGAKGQPWSGLILNIIQDGLLTVSDVIFSGWRTDNYRDRFQVVTVFDEEPPIVTEQPFSNNRVTAALVGDEIHVTIEADEAGGVSRRRYESLLKSMYDVFDPCDRPTSMVPTFPTEALETFWPVSTTAQSNAFEITWTARDPGPNLSFERNETPVVMRVEVVDTRPPVIVPPDDIVEVDTGSVDDLGQPLVFDFVDLNPTVTNDAVLPIGLGLTVVNWTVTDASGNSDSATQIVNVKASNLPPTPIAQTGANRVDAVSFEPTPIRLQATDPDGDPLRFFIEEAPTDGFFVAPLYPYFVEDFRVEQSLSDAEILAICTNGQGNDRNFHLDFPSEPRHLSSLDDGRTYVVDRGYIDCRAGSPVTFDREGRIAVFGNDGSYIDGIPVNADQLRDVVLNVQQERLFLTSHASGGQSSLRVYDLDLNLQVSYRLANLRDRDGNNVSLQQPGGGNTLNVANSGVVDAKELLYVMSRYSVIHVFDGTLPPGFDCSVNCTHTPAYIGALNDDGQAFEGSGRELQLDAEGRIVAGRRSRLYRYTPSWIAADGLAYPGTLEGWLGRCDIDLAPGDQAVCDVGNRRTLGFSCTDATCAVDVAFNPEEQAICGPLGIGGQPTWGCRAGQFRGVPALDIDPQGALYVADSGNARIQRFSTDGFFAGQARSTCDGSCFVLGDFGNPQNVTVNSSRFFVLDPATNLLHISLLTPFIEIGPDYADLEYRSNNEFACVNPDDCIDGFSFRVSDGVRDPATGRPIRSAPADVEIGVVRNFRPPFATPGIAVVLDEDTPTAITLDGSDPDPLDTLSFVVQDPPAHGTVQIVGNQATYTPDPDYYSTAKAPESFSFTASDGVFVSAPERVAVTVAEVNDPPEPQMPDPATVGVGFVYRLSTDFVDPDPGEQHLLVVDWGDGTVESETGVDGGGPEVGQSGSGPGTINAEHIYTAPGTYTVELCLTDRVTGDDGSEVPTVGSLTGCDSFPVTALDGLDLVTSAQPSTERALPNQLVNVAFRVLNEPPSAGAPSTATGVELVVDLPEGLAPGSITVSGVGCALNGRTVTCNVGTLAPGFAGAVDITAQVSGAASPGSLLTFEANATGNEADVNPDNEVAHVISVAPPADLYVDAIGEEAFRDKSDINPGDGLCESEDGVCTLRAAIEEANAQPGLRTVAVGTGVYALDEGPAIEVTDDLVLIGNGAARSIIDRTNGFMALLVSDANVLLRIEDLTVARGGIRAWPGDLVIRRVRITGGVADGFVGGAIIANNLIDIRDTLIDGNRAVSGGGVWAQASSHGIFENVTITGNRGGGLYLGGSDYTLNHVTITGNSGDTGGASGVGGGALTVANTATVTITGSVLAGNYRPPGRLDVPRNCVVDSGATLISGGDNLLGDLADCGLAALVSDIVIDDAQARLQPLQTRDAALPFVAPFRDSPAVDAMFGPGCPPADAIGTPRPVDGDNDGQADCDIGAIELVPDLTPPELSLSTTALDFGDIDPGSASPPLSILVTNTGEIALEIGTATFAGPGASSFDLVSDGCSGRSIAAAGICSVSVRFAPSAAGVATATLNLPSNDPAGTRTIALTGSSDVMFADGFE